MTDVGVSIQLANPAFEIRDKLGEGGSGSAFRVCVGDREFTLKVGDAQRRHHLAAEAERLALCVSTRLPSALQLGELPATLRAPDGSTLPRGAPYVLLSYSPGVDLQQRLGDADDALLPAVARDVSEALLDLHTSGFAHGDVKPANIIVEGEGAATRCTLIDLGLSEQASTENASGGTVRYLAPEVTHPELSSDARARDLWALGLVLLELAVPRARTASEPLQALSRCPPHLKPIIAPLLSVRPAARPSADWVFRQFRATAFDAARATAHVHRSYLKARSRQLRRIANGARHRITVEGTPGAWLASAARVLQQLGRLRGNAASEKIEVLASLNEAEQRRWLVDLVGPTGIDFPPIPARSDAALVERLLTLAQKQPPESFTHAAITQNTDPVELPRFDDAELFVRLGADAPEPHVLCSAERRAFERGLPDSALLTLCRALRRRHELPRALALLALSHSKAAQVERAHNQTRLGDLDAAQRSLEELLSCGELEPDVRGNALALLARLWLMRGDQRCADDVLRHAPPSVRVLAAKAAVQLTRGQLDEARQTLERALSFPHDAEDRARIEALLANWAQQSGETDQALSRFRKAAEHAARSSSLLEEATYLAGVSSTATNAGLLGEAIAAAERSELLFRHIGNPEAAARAVLSRASALSIGGGFAEALQAAEDSRQLARQAGDRRCQGFTHLVASDVTSHSEALEHIERAASLLEPLRDDDALRIAARRLRRGALTPDVISSFDELAVENASVDARLDWWEARARQALDQPDAAAAAPIIQRLLALVGSLGSVGARGPAFAFGSQLAATVGDGDSARRLAQAAADAHATLQRGLPPDLELRFGQLQWTAALGPREAVGFSVDQLQDIETLIHGLSERESLKSLLNRVLDALVLWTSVERGLLLLTAPGGKLVPRAARNLARADLHGEQLRLSTTLAEKALDSGECIVAVDAALELPEVHASVHSLKLRSVLAVPLQARGQVIGVAYLDDRMRRGAFGPRELEWVRLVGTLAAVAIADARSQLQLRRAARKARRAEERVTQLLARREAELLVAERELAHSRKRSTRHAYDDIIGQSAPMQKMLELVDRVTDADIPVLVLGESGSGKELVARAIHYNGARSGGPFVGENCSAIPESLLESTLFGHVRGAFTGANRHHAGLFEVAHRGTLFLDEIADMSLGMQAKLLRVLENGEIRRVGSERSTRVDVRVIGATHKDLKQLVEAGRFRQDLYYRLNVITVSLPPLRERRSDIPLLVRHFLKKYARDPHSHISAAALDKLVEYAWPGNVRQLENEVRRALVLADGEVDVRHLSEELCGRAAKPLAQMNLRQRLDALEIELVGAALHKTAGNQTQAAKLLGVSRFGLQKMIRRLGIDIDTKTNDDDHALRS